MALNNHMMIMANNLVNAATITGGPFHDAAGFGADQMQNDELSRPARTLGTTAIIKVALEKPSVANTICIPVHNLTDGATWRVRVGNDPDLLGASPGLAGTTFDSASVFGDTSSTTQTTIGTGQRTVRVAGNLRFLPGATVRVAADIQNYFEGQVVSFFSNTGVLTLNVTEAAGTGQYSGWNVTRYVDAQSVWPNVEPHGVKNWGEFPWGGRFDSGEGYNPPGIMLLPDMLRQQYYLIEISDVNNPAGFIDINRLIIASRWQPTFNVNYGHDLGFVDPSNVKRSWGGNVVINKKRKWRRFSGTLANMPEQERYNRVYEMQRTHGTTDGVLVVLNPTDSFNLHRNTLYCHMPTINPPVKQGDNRYSVRLEFEEKL